MLAYTIRRLLVMIPVLLVATFVVFIFVSLSGDPLSQIKHPPSGKPPSPQVIALREHQLRLDQPLLERYWHWITGVVHGDWGPSTQGNGLNIGHEIWHRLGITFRLVFLAMVLAAILAIIVGLVSAVKQYTAVDYSFTFVGFLFLSLPVFWFAVLLKQQAIKFNEHVGHTVLYTIGDQSIPSKQGLWNQTTDIAGHIILPTIVLALVSFASW